MLPCLVEFMSLFSECNRLMCKFMMFDVQSRSLSWSCEQRNEPDMVRSKKFRNLHKEFKLCNFIKRAKSRHKVSIRMKVTFQCLNDGESSGFRFRLRFEIAKGGKSESTQNTTGNKNTSWT